MDTELLAALGIDFRRIDKARVAYIHLYYERKRKQDRLATDASNRWEARKAVLVARCHATPGWTTDSKTFRDLCDQDYALNDAMQAWSWHERESKRCLGVIQSELLMEAMRQSALPSVARPPEPRSAGGVPSRG